MGKLTFEQFITEQRAVLPPVLKADLTGKTVIVTGGNSGLGLDSAKHFATMNPERLILACRTVEKGEEAAEIIKEETGYAKAEAWPLELSQFASVSAFADRAEKELDRVDILVENAAVSSGGEYIRTEDGWEIMLQVNALAPAMHALLLLPKMLETAKKYNISPRVVTTSSDAHHYAQFSPEILNASNILEAISNESSFKYDTRYGQDKVLNVTFTRALAQHTPSSPPTIIPVSLNPGFCITNLPRNASPTEAVRLNKNREEHYPRTSEQGSRQIVFAALADCGSEDEMALRGGYVKVSRWDECSDWIMSEEGRKLQEKTWNEMLELFGRFDSRIKTVVAECLTA